MKPDIEVKVWRDAFSIEKEYGDMTIVDVAGGNAIGVAESVEQVMRYVTEATEDDE